MWTQKRRSNRRMEEILSEELQNVYSYVNTLEVQLSLCLTKYHVMKKHRVLK